MMRRHARGPVLDNPVMDLSIQGDKLEHDRIQLEQNLQHTDLSLHLSSQDDDTVEYPRHNSAPSAFHEFVSFDRHSRDYDQDMQSQIHAWSYGAGADDDEGISPYGETLSTAAHHASALTLSAGLGGRRGKRDASLSGAEYDPERPLHDMMAAVDPKLSIFDADPSRSHYEHVYESFRSPGKLDRVLESGHAPISHSRSVRIRSPHSSASSSASSDSDSPRPRLADALQRVSFSPKRPRSPQTSSHQPNHRHAQVPPSPLTRNVSESHNATPRPQRRPATVAPSPSPQSQFTKAARGITRDLIEEQDQMNERNPFSDRSHHNENGQAHHTTSQHRGTTHKSRIYLPDVTGLTNAVESPAKAGGKYNAYSAVDRPRDSEAKLLSILSTVQAKLHELEDENAISRRRVRELELELEACKREVARERTKILEQEELSMRYEASAKGKGKARASNRSFDSSDLVERYKEAVEEKKALESLISSLRTHLTRLTAELSSHQELLTELRLLREKDSKALKEKTGQVDILRQEVERLAGEVEVLRGVVEEGLRERRATRDASESHSDADVGMTADLEETTSEEEDDDEDESFRDDDVQPSDGSQHEEHSEPEPFDPESILGSSRQNLDRTMRTDHATLGSASNSVPRQLSRDVELERIAADIEERRSELSHQSSQERSRASTPTRQRRRPTVEEVSETNSMPSRAPSPVSRTAAVRRPAGPTPSRARAEGEPETPFPQIRGAHLERLFFSAPEHNARSCTVCCRRREPIQNPPSWLSRRNLERSRDEDEIRGENDVDYKAAARKAGLPPQTLVTRVIRDLEDDFTHYKGVYVELADQYKEMDAVSDVPKRNLTAKHLREVVDILEQKGDQIASLYDCLTFKDKPIPKHLPTHLHLLSFSIAQTNARNFCSQTTMSTSSERPLTYFDLTIGDKPLGRVVFQLYTDLVPKTAENFRELVPMFNVCFPPIFPEVHCALENVESATQGSHYGIKDLDSIVLSKGQSNAFFRANVCTDHLEQLHVPGRGFHCREWNRFVLLDLAHPIARPHHDLGGESIYGEKFEDEAFTVNHTRPFLLSMANAGPNTNGSQFFITTVPTAHLDGKHVVFGEVIKGKSLIRQVENFPTSSGDVPTSPVVISDCGVLSPDDPSLKENAASAEGDAYEDFPEDNDGDLNDPATLLKIATELRALATSLYKEGKTELALDKYQKAIRYLDHSPPQEEEKEMVDAFNAILAPLLLNSALIAVRIRPTSTMNATVAVTATTRALNKLDLSPADKAKALYRRALARVIFKDEEQAEEDLVAALSHVPDDAAISNELANIRKHKKEKRDKEKKAYKKMFN
ncbi:unnamed protein product [Mycena citricolor]|uniref:peptidylprolyl isomerase n=1 Tax=Mycena citricolor TaxID=2018698 RepID=A0AAD2H6N4_9AGAR|nr:unnamed protein product [Mycena citricolor]